MLVYVLERLGVALLAASAALVAGRSCLDVLGVVTLAYITALGGITLREVLMNRLPIPWIRDTSYQFAVLMASMTTMLYVRTMPPVPPIVGLVLDSLGMIFISMASARKAEQAHLPSICIGLVACISGCLGGVLRDVTMHQIPQLFLQHVYATSVVAGASAYVLLQGRGVRQPVSFWISLGVAVLLRFSALFGGLELPFFNPPEAPFAPTRN
ncbi:MAG: trimeric intracellular cation channel family protein [Candidatus Methylacidiphilales bacterium]|nr:TRIC cation channel family protein [Candidatus Methylacidiphilales bacterium]